jgi:very-short-patch-repair endonuclease
MRENDHPSYGWRSMTERRIELRTSATEAEALLWDRIKSKQFCGQKFRRQHGIGRFVVDFYHGQSRTVIELDGFVHNDIEVAENDRNRQEFLEELGYRFLRFRNEEVINNLESVLAKILNFIEHS